MGLGPWPWNYGITPKLLRNYSETEEQWNSEITPKLGNRDTPKLRTVELWNYSEITPKLLRNHSEITPKLWDYGTVAVELWNYSEIKDRGTMELLRNYCGLL